MEIERPGPPYRQADGAWVVTRYDDVMAVLRSPLAFAPEPADLAMRVSRRMGGKYDDIGALIGHYPIFLNSGKHAGMRRYIRDIVQSVFTGKGKAVYELAVSELVESLPADQDVDAAHEIGYALPDRLICKAAGFDEMEVHRIREAGHGLFSGWRAIMPLREFDARQGHADRYRKWFARQWSGQGCPLTTGVNPHGKTANPFAEHGDSALLFLITIVNETQAGFLGNALHHLAGDPNLQNRLRETPGLIAGFVEEALRCLSSVRRRTRIVRGGELNLPEASLPNGATVHVMLESAGRDPSAFADPDRFDIARKGPPLLSFGAGPHLCLGTLFARALARCFFEALLRKFTVLPGDGPAVIQHHAEIRQFKTLPLRFLAV